jgi:hypothetical protein
MGNDDGYIAKDRVFKMCDQAEKHLATGGMVAHIYLKHPENRKNAAMCLSGRGYNVEIDGETVIVKRRSPRR